MSKKPLKATDKRRIAGRSKRGVKAPSQDGAGGAGAPLAALFNDRRRPNGSGKKAF